MKRILMLFMTLAVGCGGDTETDDADGNRIVPMCPPNCSDAGNQQMDDKKGIVTRCLGPSCPRGECGFSGDCSAYQGFDALDSSQLCGSASGSQQFCVKYEVPKDDGFVDIFEQVVSCADVTVVKISCNAGCGYNYAPDDCAVCNGQDGCAFD